MVLFAVSPALVLLGVIWWIAGAGWAIFGALGLLLTGGAFIVFRR